MDYEKEKTNIILQMDEDSSSDPVVFIVDEASATTTSQPSGALSIEVNIIE